MTSVLPDASVWIAWLRSADPAVVRRTTGAGVMVWLSAVALQELYAGARGKHRDVIEALEREFTEAERILVPDLSDWKKAGFVLSEVAQRFGYEQIGRSRLSNDALLAVTAAHHKLTFLTANPRDFARLAEFLPFDWRQAGG